MCYRYELTELRMALRSSLTILTRLGRPGLRLTSVRAASSQANLPINMGVMFVPQQEAWVVERMGAYNRILSPGLNFLIPILDK